ncbi:hypothetical protein L5M43_06250 [Shewanella sp. SW36]|uniref:hypothetical protein n=1 Tax=unclassified Shewanella TaxID=196818 RepID=UPI0021DAD11F|nr:MULTISPECIES: hypothetical protein [unclassified Shewanella]MCU7974880.1 hypothetical protein [Shewanella sp. SW36]MCU7990269.1 hypothetical protein [Shewanella sp. SW1]MCU8052727.1 hypothetical protein [Shewanella sp. SM43]
MKVQIISGVMIRGTAVFPKTGEGKSEVDSVVEVSKAEARDLVRAGQAKVVKDSIKVTVEIKDPEGEADALDDFFGDDADEQE